MIVTMAAGSLLRLPSQRILKLDVVLSGQNIFIIFKHFFFIFQFSFEAIEPQNGSK